MTSTPLAHAEKRMQQRWYELVMAEQKGAAEQVLERMYNAYIRAVDEYNRRLAAIQRHAESTATSEEAQHTDAMSEMHASKRKKKAS
jgi:anthranilate/para-aminobenzoate synthase component II